MKRLLLTTAASLAFAGLAHAEATAIDGVVVTSTRLESRPEDQPGVRVITGDDIARTQASFAGDILETIPGVSLSRNGDFGGVSSVRIRGASADKTLVLVDGVVQNDPSSPSGGFDFAGLDLADVERIEVLSGPQGSLWGSDAIGGAIAFTTRELDGWRASLEGGAFGTVRAAAALGFAGAGGALGLSLSGYSSDGVSKAASGTEKDGFESWSAGINGRLTLSPGARLEGRVRYTESDADIDGYAPPFYLFGDTDERAESRAWTGFGRLTADDLFGLDQTLSLSLHDLTRDNISAYSSHYDARRTTGRWTAGRGGPDDAFAFLLGAERDDTEASISTGDTAELGATSAFAVIRFSPLDPVSVTASLRYDDPDGFAGETTARVSALTVLEGGFRLAGSYGQGFKTPTISQVVCDFCWPAGPSTGLRPETGEGWDLALSWRSPDDRLYIRLTGYQLAVKDQISYGVGRYVNIDRTRTTGLEAEGEAGLTPRLSLKASYAYADGIDESTGLRLIRVPEHSGSVSLSWTGERLGATLTLRAEGDQADSNPSTFSRDVRTGFVTANLAGSWKINDQFDLTGRVVNLTDEDWRQSLGYGEAGRGLFVGFRLRN